MAAVGRLMYTYTLRRAITHRSERVQSNSGRKRSLSVGVLSRKVAAHHRGRGCANFWTQSIALLGVFVLNSSHCCAGSVSLSGGGALV